MSWGRGCHCHYVGIDGTLGCKGGGALIVTVWGLMEHLGCHGGGDLIVTVGNDEALGCNEGGALTLIVTVWGLMKHWGAMGEGISLSLCGD